MENKNIELIISYLEKTFNDKITKELKKIKEDTIAVIRAESRTILKEIILKELRESNIVEKIIVNLSKDGWKPIINAVYYDLYSKITNNLSKAITQKININTSELSILNQEIRMSKFDMGQLRHRGLKINKNGEVMQIDMLK